MKVKIHITQTWNVHEQKKELLCVHVFNNVIYLACSFS